MSARTLRSLWYIGRNTIRKNIRPIAKLPDSRHLGSTSSFHKNEQAEKSTVDSAEIQLFSQMKDWWNLNGPMKPLHAMNMIRVPFVRDGLLQSDDERTCTPLKGKKILDVGCGGGILAEALARLGAEVTGIDASKELIAIAVEHSGVDPKIADNKPNYIHTSIEEHVTQCTEFYDGVVASEVIEHVNNQEVFVKSCIKALKPGGRIFFTTPNRTRVSQFVSICMAEYVLNLLPKGTHQYEKFITPTELTFLLERRLSLANGHKWHETAWKQQTTQSPGTHLKKYLKRKEQSRIRQQSSTLKHLFAPREKPHPDKHYGPEACDPIDIDEAQLKIQCEERLPEFQKSPENIALIEITTVGQHENDLYTTHRRDRLTASQFGMFVRMSKWPTLVTEFLGHLKASVMPFFVSVLNENLRYIAVKPTASISSLRQKVWHLLELPDYCDEMIILKLPTDVEIPLTELRKGNDPQHPFVLEVWLPGKQCASLTALPKNMLMAKEDGRTNNNLTNSFTEKLDLPEKCACNCGSQSTVSNETMALNKHRIPQNLYDFKKSDMSCRISTTSLFRLNGRKSKDNFTNLLLKIQTDLSTLTNKLTVLENKISA